ncbi:hypothetical protein C1H46_024806 [Malus baccata]|uniref:Uncharacterized protein n=1 Tax=Malus baccata TaxID=106549 RepID=A0A540LT32_MALBA|nr:hypothetical protein C1H46_024806 [Malus baccata]
MKTQSKSINTDIDSFWNWKSKPLHRNKHDDNRFSFTEVFHSSPKAERKVVLGPGGGAGIGCGAGVGFGLVGGMGYGGWCPWNQVKLVFGVGVGCGVGLGFGFGQGIGYGFSLESLLESSDSGKAIQVYHKY